MCAWGKGGGGGGGIWLEDLKVSMFYRVQVSKSTHILIDYRKVLISVWEVYS